MSSVPASANTKRNGHHRGQAHSSCFAFIDTCCFFTIISIKSSFFFRTSFRVLTLASIYSMDSSQTEKQIYWSNRKESINFPITQFNFMFCEKVREKMIRKLFFCPEIGQKATPNISFAVKLLLDRIDSFQFEVHTNRICDRCSGTPTNPRFFETLMKIGIQTRITWRNVRPLAVV